MLASTAKRARMDAEHVRLIREGWAQVAPRSDETAKVFYTRLFELAPETRPMFAHVDMDALGGKFMDMIGTLIRLLDEPGDLVTQTIPTARRHASYGVTDHHLDMAGVALLDALQETLGDAFTPDARHAWARLYDLTSAVMRRASQRVAPTASA